MRRAGRESGTRKGIQAEGQTLLKGRASSIESVCHLLQAAAPRMYVC